ncbi:ATP-binding protein [Hansschlegelia quercus]|uniref:histidine kinase n=1 Tax=Hansschlegelia quercus TaxID=2528245 RepID=A0A4Q9GJ56_9HYPH|nr:PAS domain-containing hybrid sensor histidine kinase/response regulator [Hansschlegelia quercus]TBN52478.1 response regulator [Hansschlegelia quercus]
MSHRTGPEGHKVLILAPYGRDAESAATLLSREGHDTHVCVDLPSVATALDEGTGVVLVTEEALRDAAGVEALQQSLKAQPYWSDVPFILLTTRSTERSGPGDRTGGWLFNFVSNAIVLERPLGLASLLSATASALRSRQKQFEMRDRLADLDRTRVELVERENQLRLATEAAEIGLWDVDPINDVLYWPPRVKKMFGLSADAEVSMTHFYEGLHPDDRDATAAAFQAAADPGRRAVYDVEYRTIGHEDKILRWVAAKGRGVFDEMGRCVRLIGTAIDVTARKAAELQLRSLNEELERHVAERTDKLMAAEAALRQSHKMEAVGQLTGGIAHDFNNMLTGVIGALDLIKRRVGAGRLDDLDRFMDAASSSAQRAAALTARLLAFSRRQSLDPKPLDPNALIMSLEELLRRTIQENISLRIVANPRAPQAIADANQLESAIVNLAINARDAMPEGGQLTIETSVVELDESYVALKPDMRPGPYVVISVSDTGVGMSPEILEKIFDPFFTTKPIGQGTGLGLSMIYGFVRQSGGQVRVHSEPGVGTTVSLYLQASNAIAKERLETPLPRAPDGKGQTIFLIEDDVSVRLLVRNVLEELSYQVIEAKDAVTAIPVLRSGQTFNLIVSDVGLPGMNGRQLADIARTHHPDVPILFITGYAENAAIRAGFLGTNMQMITKPFAMELLAQRVSEMLAAADAAKSELDQVSS